MFRVREFEQMEIEYFVEPGTQDKFIQSWTDDSWKRWTDHI